MKTTANHSVVRVANRYMRKIGIVPDLVKWPMTRDSQISALEYLRIGESQTLLGKICRSALRDLRNGKDLTPQQLSQIRASFVKKGRLDRVHLFEANIPKAAPKVAPPPEVIPGVEESLRRIRHLPVGDIYSMWMEGDDLHIGLHAFISGNARTTIDFATQDAAISVGAKRQGNEYVVNKSDIKSARILKILVDRLEERIRSLAEWKKRNNRNAADRVAAKYKDKKTVKKQDGGEMIVYEYSDKQIANRNRDKADKVEKLRGKIDDLRKQVRKDLKSDDPDTRSAALAVGLMDVTYERVGNSESAKEGHFGVTGWRVKHLTFGKGKVTIKYVGKSGVDHEKVVDTAESVAALKDAVKGKKPNDEVVDASAEDVNAYLKPFGISAKDIRGYHANTEMQTRLKAVRSKGGTLPTDKKERKKKLKDEFKEALEATAEAVGHEAATLKSQYLVPGLEDEFMKDGRVTEKLTKKATTGIKVYLDDNRPTPPGWVRCYWPNEVIKLLKTGRVGELSLDHDLGNDARGTGYDVILWLEEAVATRGFNPPRIAVHSANPSARQKMEAGIRSINRFYDRMKA